MYTMGLVQMRRVDIARDAVVAFVPIGNFIGE